MIIQIKAMEQYFPVMLFIMLCKMILTLESVDEILKCDHSSESYWAVLSCGTVYYAVQGGFNFWVCGWNPKVWMDGWLVLHPSIHRILHNLDWSILFLSEIGYVFFSDSYNNKCLKSHANRTIEYCCFVNFIVKR